MQQITQSHLKKMLFYNPNTGVFTWKAYRGNSIKIGDVAGYINKGYIRIRVAQKLYFAHRLAWLYVHGYFPENEIDHKNGIPSDNRLENLREVSKVCNLQNAKSSINNTTGFKGVSFHKPSGKFTAYIQINKKRKFIGRFKKAIDAAKARLNEEILNPLWHCNEQNVLVMQIKNYEESKK